jgi:hypothetical protein
MRGFGYKPMKKMPKTVRVLIAFSVAFIAAKAAWNIAYPSGVGRSKAIVANETPQVGVKKTCDELIVTVKGLSFNLPREVAITQDGESRKYSRKNCAVNVIKGNITNIRWLSTIPEPGNNRITIQVSPFLHETTFSMHRKLLLENGYKTRNGTGIFRLDRVNSEIYVLPESWISTENNEPVAFFCGGSLSNKNDNFYLKQCETAYMHPKGFRLGYRFFREAKDGSYQNVPEEFANIDSRIRVMMDKAIVK